MDAQQAIKVLDNKQAMQNISDQTKRELESIVEKATRPAAQASGGTETQPVTSSGQARQAQAATSGTGQKPPSTPPTSST